MYVLDGRKWRERTAFFIVLLFFDTIEMVSNSNKANSFLFSSPRTSRVDSAAVNKERRLKGS